MARNPFREHDTDSVTKLDITWNSILRVAIFLAAAWLAYTLRSIVFLIFLVGIFVAAANSAVLFLQQWLSRTIAVVAFYVILLAAIFGLGSIFIPSVVEEINNLVRTIPSLIDTLRPVAESLHVERYTDALQQSAQGISTGASQVGANVVNTVVSLFGGLAAVITGLVLSFYVLLEEPRAKQLLKQFIPDKERYEIIYDVLKIISKQLGAWVRGQLTIMAIVAVLNSLVFFILGLPSPLALGSWSGLMELIPYIGPLLGVIPGIVVAAFAGSLAKVILVIIINYVFIQQVQNMVITPRVMSKAIGISPVLIILAIMIGASLFGVVGTVIALPCAAIVTSLINEWPRLKQFWRLSNIQ